MKHLYLESILSMFFCMVSLTASAYDRIVDGIYYNLNSSTNEAEVAFYKLSDENANAYQGSVIIPSSFTYGVKTYNVTSIGSGAFSYCSGLTSIDIPNSVTSIGDYAFFNCSGLTSIDIPNSVTTIGEGVLAGCSSLVSVIINNGNTTYDSRNNCNAIIETATNKLIAGSQNTTIPNSVTSIGELAFYNCSSLTSVTIPNSVTSIGNRAFFGCINLTSVTIPNSVTTIGYSAFESCSGLTSITIPNSVITIEEKVFSGCSGLTSITIPNSVTTIGEKAFSGCSSLTSITIPNSVTSIEKNAFWECSSLASVSIGNGVTSIGESVFSNCSGLTSIDIPNNVTSIGLGAFFGCSGLTSIDIPNSVTSIGGYAFYGCKGLSSIDIPNSVTTIGGCAFSYCSGLTSITIPNSVTTMGNQAFDACSGLNKVIIPDVIKWCGISFADATANPLMYAQRIFKDENTEVTELDIPNNVSSIGNFCFNGCKNLRKIVIGSGIETIGNLAFGDCKRLLDLYCYAVPYPETANNAFSGVNCEFVTLHVPARAVSQYSKHSVWGQFMETVAIESGEEHPVYLVVNQAEKGSVKMEVNPGEMCHLCIEPANGWRIHSVSYGGKDVTSQIDALGNLTIPAITETSVLNVIFEKGSASAVQSAETLSTRILATSEGISVTGVSEGETIRVYSEDGTMQKVVRMEGIQMDIPLEKGLHIVKVGNKVVKLLH